MNRAEEWKRKAATQALEQAEELELPSGMVIRARRPDPLQLAAWGALPFDLVVGHAAAGEADVEAVRRMAAAYREILVWCCVEPRVSLAPMGPEEIHPRDIPEADWRFIVRWAMRAEEASAVRGFRVLRGNGSRGGDGEILRDSAEPGAAGAGPGDGV